MTHFQNLDPANKNLANDQVPHRDKIIGLEDKKQPMPIHTDAKSYEEKHEKVPEGLIQKEEMERQNMDEKRQGSLQDFQGDQIKSDEHTIPEALRKEEFPEVPNKNISQNFNQNQNQKVPHQEKKNILEKAKDTVVEGVKHIGQSIKNVFKS